MQELSDEISLHSNVTIDDGEIVHHWRANLSKYSEMPGIRSLHDIVIVRSVATAKVVCKTQSLCYEGSFSNATIPVMAGSHEAENVTPDETKTYLAKNKLRELSETKLNHPCQMSRSFEHHFKW